MNSSGKHKKDFSHRLPNHKPVKDLWAGIEAGIGESSAPIWKDNLPRRKPAPATWDAIGKQLPLAWYSWNNPYIRVAIVLVFLLLVPTTFVFFEKGSLIEHPLPDQETFSLPSTPNRENNVISESLPQNNSFEQPVIKNQKSPINIETVKAQLPKMQQATFYTKEKISDKPPVKQSQFKDQERFEKNQIIGQSPTEKMSFVEEPAESIIRQPDPPFTETSGADIIPFTLPEPKLYRINSSVGKSNNLMENGAHKSLHNFNPKTSFEAGIYYQPGFVKNISSLNNNWYPTSSAGLSLTMRKKHLLFETGISYNWFEFYDHLELDYYAYEFLGTIISTERYTIENYIDELGHPQTRKKYIVELIDIYDSTFLEEEQTGRVKMTSIEMPLYIGYRLAGGGNYYADVKTGFNVMMITTVEMSHTSPEGEIIREMGIQNNLPQKYTMKLKYQIALALGYRINENISAFIQPTVLWHLEGVSSRENGTYQRPLEARLQIGLRWEFY
jgi:hypothetical protein